MGQSPTGMDRMRSSTKATIGFGSIWGLFAFGACLLTSFTIGTNDTAPELIAIAFYGLTLLPACVLAVWFQRKAALWLIGLFPLSFLGALYQVVKGPQAPDENFMSMALGVLGIFGVCAIPAVLGTLLLRTTSGGAKDLADN